jgi:hypothetical protein
MLLNENFPISVGTFFLFGGRGELQIGKQNGKELLTSGKSKLSKFL